MPGFVGFLRPGVFGTLHSRVTARGSMEVLLAQAVSCHVSSLHPSRVNTLGSTVSFASSHTEVVGLQALVGGDTLYKTPGTRWTVGCLPRGLHVDTPSTMGDALLLGAGDA